jgi:hypothetical protein
MYHLRRRRKRTRICEIIHLICRNSILSTSHFRTHCIHAWEIHYTLSPATNFEKTVSQSYGREYGYYMGLNNYGGELNEEAAGMLSLQEELEKAGCVVPAALSSFSHRLQ